MQTYKFFWDTHKWVGIGLSLVLVSTAVTGFLLLIKKKSAWIQPPVAEATEGTVDDFVPISAVVASVLAEDHPHFQSADDIGRIDLRPDDRVHRVQSIHGQSEIQVDAVTGAVLHVDVRRSDLLESIHDGSFVGPWFHDWVMPAVAVLLMFLVGSGLYLWLQPIFRRARNGNGRPPSPGQGRSKDPRSKSKDRLTKAR